MGATKHSAYRLLMRELNVQRRTFARALELTTADLRITSQPQILRTEINALRNTLKTAAKLAYGHNWEIQLYRLLEVAREESMRCEVEPR